MTTAHPDLLTERCLDNKVSGAISLQRLHGNEKAHRLQKKVTRSGNGPEIPSELTMINTNHILNNNQTISNHSSNNINAKERLT